MLYQFLLSYTPTDGPTQATYVANPLYGDSLSVVTERKSGEWYYTRRLDGNLTFVREDYKYIMSRPFDGSFSLEIRESHDSGANWYTYFRGNFSRASLIIDQDNLNAILEGLQEDIYDVIDNGKSETYDLCKLLPDSTYREVNGKVPPALAMVDFNTNYIDYSDMYSGGALTAGGYRADSTPGWNDFAKVTSNAQWRFMGVFGECKVEMKDVLSHANGNYAGTLEYVQAVSTTAPYDKTTVTGFLYSNNGYFIRLYFTLIRVTGGFAIIHTVDIYDDSSSLVAHTELAGEHAGNLHDVISPTVLIFDDSASSSLLTNKIEMQFHYIRATLLTASASGAYDNVLDTGNYYKGMRAFQGSGLTISTSTRTSDQPNGHRIVSGTQLYFDAPDSDPDWIPLAENSWNYASLWYKIVPSELNGLLNQANFNAVVWDKCWTIGTCIAALLDRISHGDVIFQEMSAYSHFLHDTLNPVEGHEQFDYLVTQKSNVMSSSADVAKQCNVCLNWFLELLRNALNCYWFLVRRNDGKYDFHIEHVEYFRRGGSYDGSLSAQIDLTAIKPYRNFLADSQPVKRLSDQTNKYSYNLDDMSEKYTFGWQGNGGGQDFKGNPMFFKAGWIQRAKYESHEVDNIFADLGWLMLNAGTDAESSNNKDGLFIFGAYKADTSIQLVENSTPTSRSLTLSSGRNIYSSIDIILTAPQGAAMALKIYRPDQQSQIQTLETFTGTGAMQVVSINYESAFIAPRVLIFDFGVNYSQVTVHRIHAHESFSYYVANLPNLLRQGSYLQNGALAWPWLQNEHLHYDIPAQKWSYDSDDLQDASFLANGTVKMAKVQSIGICPFLDADPDTSKGVKTGLGIGIINSATVNLSSRNVTFELIYNINQ